MVIHCIVKGKVQGVWFRQATMEKANELKITGWVRNMDNGDVEVLASGEEDQLDLFKSWMWEGSANARVEEILVENAEDQVFSGFSVK
ncbi:MAG: acylphosphatase [Gammaproteobacteria bacterium]|nr:acylphosphatase [Gammaproteobacteria bacterium]